jgi:hypothetical protein
MSVAYAKYDQTGGQLNAVTGAFCECAFEMSCLYFGLRRQA